MEQEKILKNSVDSVSISGTSIILYQMIKCVCKIKLKNNVCGTGFFCRIPYGNNNTMICLITNYHVIDEKYFKENNNIDLLLNNENDGKIIDLRIERKNYFNKDYDITIIELKKTDKIKHVLELDDNLFKDETRLFFEGKSIYSIQYQKGDNAVVSYGLMNRIDNYDIKHTCNTTKGSSGSPILNLSNNKVIGIHKEGSVIFNFNKGTFLKFPLSEFLEKINIDDEIRNKNINKLIEDEKFNIIKESSIKENMEKTIEEIMTTLSEGKTILYNNNNENKNNKTIEKCVKLDNKGNKYEGYLKNGNYEGEGTMHYTDGARYEGNWKNGKYEGKGKIYYSDNARYEGYWKNGKYDGIGTMYYTDGARYEGNWKNGRYDGVGTMYYSDGGRYEGDWKEGKYEGNGKMYYGDGARYEGGFKNGKREGKGAMFYTNGTIEKGEWKDDKKLRKGFFFGFW